MIKRLSAALKWGDWSYDQVTFCGKNCLDLPEGISADQEMFAKSIELGPVSRHRSMTPKADLTPAELTEYRSGVGCFMRLVKETLRKRPVSAPGDFLPGHLIF